MKPPDAQPYDDGKTARSPATWMRRIGAACETAQRFSPVNGVIVRFSIERQKFCVALPPNHCASAHTPPVMLTSSGLRPRPLIEVLNPMCACTS